MCTIECPTPLRLWRIRRWGTPGCPTRPSASPIHDRRLRSNAHCGSAHPAPACSSRAREALTAGTPPPSSRFAGWRLMRRQAAEAHGGRGSPGGTRGADAKGIEGAHGSPRGRRQCQPRCLACGAACIRPCVFQPLLGAAEDPRGDTCRRARAQRQLGLLGERFVAVLTSDIDLLLPLANWDSQGGRPGSRSCTPGPSRRSSARASRRREGAPSVRPWCPLGSRKRLR
jgi:hypothetical protein